VFEKDSKSVREVRKLHRKKIKASDVLLLEVLARKRSGVT
jgi:hypothetical protein